MNTISDPEPDFDSGDEGDEPAQSTVSVWQLHEQEIKVPKRAKGGGPSTDTSQKTLYLWKLDPTAALPPDDEPKRYCIFYTDLQWNSTQKVDDARIFFVKWDRVSKLRYLPPYIDAGTDRTLKAVRYQDNRSFDVLTFMTKRRTDQQLLWPQKIKGNAKRTDYFDKAFALGQQVSKTWHPRSIDHGWSELQNQAWTETTDGKLDENAISDSMVVDGRTFKARTDGIAFITGTPGGQKPSKNEVYVKLSRTPQGKEQGAATNLLLYDSAAKGRGITSDGIYIVESTMKLLMSGNYDWDAAHGNVYIRLASGNIDYIFVTDERGDYRSGTWWTSAYNAAVVKQESKAIRSRNPKGLQLLFVVTPRSRVTVNELQGMMTKLLAPNGVTIPIRQTAEVVAAAGDDAEDKKKVYNYRLGTSPFGDFETWIREEDYVSYLRCYAGREYPGDYQTIMTACTNSLNPGPTAKDNETDFQKKLKKQMEDSKANHPDEPGAIISTITISTVGNAGQPGARQTVPGQGSQVGGSASDLAKAFNWSDPADIIEGNDTGTIKWDKPGVRPAEWLHRCAFSWGNTVGIDVNQSSANIIFGSSEANSLMTRYEKSWQNLFKREKEVRKVLADQVFKTGLREFHGSLVSINTSKRQAIRAQKPSQDGRSIVLTEYKRGTKNDANSKPMITVREMRPTFPNNAWSSATDLKEGDAQYSDYWQWAEKQPLISFRLQYVLVLNVSSSLSQVFGLHATDFYPFQRGFFTRLEAELDQAILQMFAEKAISRIMDGVNARKARLSGSTTLAMNSFARMSIVDTAENVSHPDGAIPQPTPYEQPHLAIWTRVLNMEPVHAGKVELKNATIATLSEGVSILGRDISGKPAARPSSTVKNDMVTYDLARPAATFTMPLPLPTMALAVTTRDVATELPVVNVTPNPSLKNQIPSGFTVKSDIELFGIFKTTRYSFYGDKEGGIREIIPLETDVSISKLIPSLANTMIDDMVLTNTKFFYNEFNTDIDLAGMWIETDLTFRGRLQVVADVLENVFHQKDPAIRFQALLSASHDWSKPVQPPALCLRGILAGISVKFGNIIEFTDIGLSITAGFVTTPTEAEPLDGESLDWTFGIFGAARLTLFSTKTQMPVSTTTPTPVSTATPIPASTATPIWVDYSLAYYNGTLQLELRSSEKSVLNDFAGIPGLSLSNVCLSTALAVGKSPSMLNFAAQATVELRDATLHLTGYYSKSDWSIACELDDLDLRSMGDLYQDLFGESLHMPDYDIYIEEITVVVGTSGIMLNASVSIGDHTSATATITLDCLGVAISGRVANVKLNDDILLKEASLDIFIGRAGDTAPAGAGTSWHFAISGNVSTTVPGIPALQNEISATLFLQKDAKGVYQWTLYGEFKGEIRLSDVVSALKGNEVLDLALRDCCIIASSVDGSMIAGSRIPAAFSVIAGVQIAASLDSIEHFDKTMNNQKKTSLTLRAAYSTGTSAFQIGFQLSTAQTLSAKNGTLYSGPVSLYVGFVEKLPTLTAKADFFLKVAGQSDLQFSGGITIDPEGAKILIEFGKDEYWRNPFGLCEKLTLGPRVALDVGIIYAAFPLWPSTAGVVAGLTVGTTHGEAKLAISEDPSQELLALSVEKLGIVDLVDFASILFDQTIPQPGNFVQFQKFDFYLSGGTTIGTIVYPAGARFSCDAVFFDKEATLDCVVDKISKAIGIKGSLDPVEIGPLSVSGVKADTKAEFEVTLGLTAQHIYINGAVKILDLTASLYLVVDLLPTPFFQLDAQLSFSDHLDFQLHALSSKVSFTNFSTLHQLEFAVDCSFQQDILDYIAAHVHEQIKAAKEKADKGIDSAIKTLDDAKKVYDANLKESLATMDQKKKELDGKVAEAQETLRKKEEELKQTEKDLLDAFNAANKKFQDLCEQASQALDKALKDEAEAVNQARQKLRDAQQQTDKDIDGHLKDLKDAEERMKRDFGDAIGKLESARRDVASAASVERQASRDLEDAKKELEDCHWYEELYYSAKVAGYAVAYGFTKAGLETADFVLKECEDVVNGPGYKLAEGSIQTYKTAVESSRTLADGTLAGVSQGLQDVVDAQAKLVSSARTVLKDAQTASQELVNSNKAKNLLDQARAGAVTILEGLRQAVSAVYESTVGTAFKLAEGLVTTARGATAGIDLAKSALNGVEHATDAILDLGDYLINRTLTVLDIHHIKLTGDLRGLCEKGTQLKAHVDGTIAGHDVNFDLDFTPGKGEELIKQAFRLILELVGDGKVEFPQRPGYFLPLPPDPPNPNPVNGSGMFSIPLTQEQQTRVLLETIKRAVVDEMQLLSTYLESNQKDQNARDLWSRLQVAAGKVQAAMVARKVWDQNTITGTSASRFLQPWSRTRSDWREFPMQRVEYVLSL